MDIHPSYAHILHLVGSIPGERSKSHKETRSTTKESIKERWHLNLWMTQEEVEFKTFPPVDVLNIRSPLHESDWQLLN